jgi:hypothetical protein
VYSKSILLQRPRLVGEMSGLADRIQADLGHDGDLNPYVLHAAHLCRLARSSQSP